MSPQSEKDLNGAESTPNTLMVREQLRRLLAHSLFTNSKRYPVLLAYTVEQTLDGNAGELKERTIGVEAFGREPNYDVNLDPVVRTTAAEVRKRLIQYYYNPDHAGELVIELPLGSYVPSFREPPAAQKGFASEPGSVQKAEPSSGDSGASGHAEQATSRLTVRHWALIAIALLFAVFIGVAIGRMRVPKQPSNLERFWEPMTSSSGRVTYCLGEPRASVDNAQLLPPGTPLYGGLDVSDVITLARSIAPLVPGNASYRVVAASSTEFTQLREGPFVLIGAYDNAWTMRVTQGLPFGFEYDANRVRRIVDRKSPEKRSWTLQWEVPNSKLTQDYAIVARIHDNVTGEPVIVLAGILGQGTEAAGEVVSNAAYLKLILDKAPKDWDQKNLEAVIETQVIEGHPGPPTVIAVDTW
ncbi:MAG TPA: hypothetical protein VMS18_08725 [Candidatus Binatia bacterium]|nr:hypothetical protein [Candidatus Binatia bacterium]